MVCVSQKAGSRSSWAHRWKGYCPAGRTSKAENKAKQNWTFSSYRQKHWLCICLSRHLSLHKSAQTFLSWKNKPSSGGGEERNWYYQCFFCCYFSVNAKTCIESILLMGSKSLEGNNRGLAASLTFDSSVFYSIQQATVIWKLFTCYFM